ncbi:MAG: rhamnulokinase [Ignavibacteriales bacterium]|nr:rhamnulokinase [Ignavibacteriales bacterium]
MKSKKQFIAIDLGAESGRCVAALLHDQKITLHEVHRFTTCNVKYENGFHWDVLAIFNEIVEGLSKAQKNFGSHFDGIAVDTWGVDYVLLDADGRIIGYPYHYRDDRTDGMMVEAFKIVPKEKIYRQTGIQFAQYNTLFQLLSEKKRKLNLLDAADKFLMMPDFFNYMLCGKMKAEYTIASTTNLADPNTRNWSWELIDAFGLPKNIFPEMIEPGTNLGTLLPHLAEKTGLDSNIPIFASAGHDTASAVASIPVQESNWAFLSSGTWSLMGIELQEPLINSQSLEYNFTNEGGAEGMIRFLKNIIGLWTLQECKRYWQNNGNDFDYVQIAEKAREENHVSAWVDLNDQRFLKPGNMPEKIKTYLYETNQPVKDKIGFIAGVIFESLAFTYRKTLKEIEEITGKEIEFLHVVGGGTQNELLMQYTADACGVTVIAGPVEGTAAGNVGIQAIAAGVVPNLKSWRKIIGASFNTKIYKPVNTSYFVSSGKKYERILKQKEK